MCVPAAGLLYTRRLLLSVLYLLLAELAGGTAWHYEMRVAQLPAQLCAVCGLGAGQAPTQRLVYMTCTPRSTPGDEVWVCGVVMHRD
jgi:hypothetical protein